jgi:endonuclease YncB( thermonuclease family)
MLLITYFASCTDDMRLLEVANYRGRYIVKIAFAFGFCVATILAVVLAPPSNAFSAEPIDPDYVRSLSIPGHTVFVMEYWQDDAQVVARDGLKSKTPFVAISPTVFEVERQRQIQLYGVEPCDGTVVDRREGFNGTCQDYARSQLDISLRHPRVVFCRAFIGERGKPVQQGTCFAHYFFAGSLNSVDMLESQLVSIGALRLSRTEAGKPVRPDLEDAERIARKNHFGLWGSSN